MPRSEKPPIVVRSIAWLIDKPVRVVSLGKLGVDTTRAIPVDYHTREPLQPGGWRGGYRLVTFDVQATRRLREERGKQG